MPVLFLNPNRSKHLNLNKAILGFYCKFDSRIEFDIDGIFKESAKSHLNSSSEALLFLNQTYNYSQR